MITDPGALDTIDFPGKESVAIDFLDAFLTMPQGIQLADELARNKFRARWGEQSFTRMLSAVTEQVLEIEEVLPR